MAARWRPQWAGHIAIREGRMDYPKMLQVETFLGCNARCTMCTIHDWARPHGGMADEVFTRIVEQAAEFSGKLKVVSLYMDGEPLMDRDLEDRIARCKAAGLPNVGFSTNASLLRPDRGRRLMEAGLDWVTISLDSLDKETYEAIRVRLDFDAVMDNIRRFVAIRDEVRPDTKITMRFPEQESNAGEYEPFRAFWSDVLTADNDEVQQLPVHNWGHGDDDPASYGDEPCGSVFDKCVILRDGTVPLCCVDYNAEYVFGNIMETPLLEIWNNAEWRKVRQLHGERRRGELNLCATCDIPKHEYRTDRIDDTVSSQSDDQVDLVQAAISR